MPLSALLPIGGAALGVLASRTLAGLSQGLSFGSLMAGDPSAGPDKKVTESAEPRVTLDLEKALPEFLSELRERFQMEGIDLSQPFALKEDGNGGVIVDGGHPDTPQIEGILARDPKLLADFQAIAATATERRQSYSLGRASAFGEFQLTFADGSAAIRFE